MKKKWEKKMIIKIREINQCREVWRVNEKIIIIIIIIDKDRNGNYEEYLVLFNFYPIMIYMQFSTLNSIPG